MASIRVRVADRANTAVNAFGHRHIQLLALLAVVLFARSACILAQTPPPSAALTSSAPAMTAVDCLIRLSQKWHDEASLRPGADNAKSLRSKFLTEARLCSLASGDLEDVLVVTDKARITIQLRDRGITLGNDTVTHGHIQSALRLAGKPVCFQRVDANDQPLRLLDCYVASRVDATAIVVGVFQSSSPGPDSSWLSSRWLLPAIALLVLLLSGGLVRFALRARSQGRMEADAARAQLEQTEREWLQLREQHRALCKVNALYREIEDAISSGVRVIDDTGKVLHVNARLCEMTGWTSDELIGRLPPYPDWPVDHENLLREHLNLILSGDLPPSGSVMTLQHRSGTDFTARITASRLSDGKSWVTFMNDMTHEIEEQKRKERFDRAFNERMRQTILGEKAFELLHKLANSTGALANSLLGVIENLKTGDTSLASEGAAHALRTSERLNRTIESFRPWLRGEDAPMEKTSLHDLVLDAIVSEHAYADRENVSVLNLVSDKLPLFQADRFALTHTLGNLINNGVRSMRDAPIADRQLVMESWHFLGKPAGLEPSESWRLEDVERIVIAVIDRGHGISDEEKRKLLSEGLASSPEGHGWGLKSCCATVRRHHGHIEVVDNQLRRGSIFRISLPVDQPVTEGMSIQKSRTGEISEAS